MHKPLTGLFLGAGASFEAGMPLAGELTAEIKNWLTADKLIELNENWRSKGAGYSDVVINDLISVMGMSNQHYESILGYLETQSQRHGNLHSEYGQLYSWLVELVYQLLYFRQVNNRDFLAQKLPLYEGISALAKSNQPLWIFSLNHDLIVETIAAKFAIPIHTGFSSKLVTLPRRNSIGECIGEIRAETLTKQNLDEGSMHFPNPGVHGIYLLKIHGALDVFTFNDGNDLLKLLPDNTSVDAVIAALRSANEELLFVSPETGGGRINVLNEIAYADETGEMQFLRRSLLAGAYKFDKRKHQVLPKSMLKHFRANLNFVSDLVCIGYSFGDIHINQIMRDWLEFSANRSLTIVNPGLIEVPNFLLHLAPQVKIVPSSATDYLDSVAEIKRSEQDQLIKKLAALCRGIGKEKSTNQMRTFFEEDAARSKTLYIDKLKAIPLIDGKLNLEGLGDPNQLAKAWAEEIQGTTESRLQRLIKYLSESGNNT